METYPIVLLYGTYLPVALVVLRVGGREKQLTNSLA